MLLFQRPCDFMSVKSFVVFLAALCCASTFGNFADRKNTVIKVRRNNISTPNYVANRDRVSRPQMLNLPLFVSGTGRDETYQLQLSVGTPAQQFNLTLDTTQWDTYLFSVNPVYENDSESCPMTMSNRHLYDPRLSQTYDSSDDNGSDGQFGDDVLVDCYADPACHKSYFYATGASFADVFEFDGFTVNNTQAWLMTNLSGAINPAWVSDGVFGIIPDLKGLALPNSPAQNFMRTFQTMLIHYSSGDAGSTGSSLGGSVTFGVEESDHCSNNWTVVASAGAKGGEESVIWGVNIGSFAFGSMNVSVNLPGTFYSTTTYIHLPSAVFAAVIAEVGAEYDVKSDQYVVDCDKRHSMRAMIFNLNNGAGGSPLMEHYVPATDYARKMTLSDDNCVLLIVEDDNMVEFDLWILGTTFNRPYCQLFNYNKGGDGTLAFSKAIR